MTRVLSIPDGEPLPTGPGARAPRVSRWSIPADDRVAPDARPSDRPRASIADPNARVDPVQVLLRWTDELDEERAVSLWIGLATADDDTAREAALVRWIDWAAVPVPMGVRMRDLVAAADELLTELESIAREPERVELHDEYDRRSLIRALRAWIRARDADPVAVLGGVRAVLLAESLGGAAPARESDRVVLANVLRRSMERMPARDAVPMFYALAQVDASAAVFAPYAESILDFLLLDGETHQGYPRELAQLASLLTWSNTVRLGLAGIGRPAIRAARLLAAVAAHPDVARGFEPHIAREIGQHLVRALGHPRFGVWSRAARAMGRLAGDLPAVAAEIQRLLDPSAPAAIRRRAHTALSTLAPNAREDLIEKRKQLVEGNAEGWLIAAFALGLPDLVAPGDDAWVRAVRNFASRGGPESWATLVLALREIATRFPDEAPRARELAGELRALAEKQKIAAAADGELVERTLALAARVVGQVDAADTTPWMLNQELCALLAANPADPATPILVAELSAHTDQVVVTALRALSQDQPRTAARASIVLEEVVDLVVDGDLAVVGERIAIGQAREAAITYADALRKKLLKTVLTGLRRPTPATPAWRRWLLRAAAVLPRLEPIGTKGVERERVVREQVLDTLPRLADDPALQQPNLQRHVLAALLDLADVLQVDLAGNAPMVVMVWIALRTGALPVQARARRVLESVPPERIDQLYAVVEQLARSGRGNEHDLLSLASLTGDRCRLGDLLMALARELVTLAAHRPEAHWSGLPKLDVTTLARVADEFRRARDEAQFALTREEPRSATAAGETLLERAGRLNRSLTSASLKFVDAARRAEIAEHYVSDLSSLCEAIATACGPVAGTPVRAQLARTLVAIRAQATDVSNDREVDVRYIARLRVLGSLASADEGGMTNTYLAEGPAPGKRVVVKLLPWERFAGVNAEMARTLFEGEMRRLAPIVHPNVVSIIDAGFVEEGAYIALELIPGASLETILRKVKRISLERLAPIIRDAARGLSYLHARGIVHRDIKPGNILVQLDGLDGAPLTAENWESAQFIRSVVIDLGIATDSLEASKESDGSLIGTPGYLAPEIARGLETTSPAIDVYALAVVAFEALTGSNPYLEGDPELHAMLVRHGTMTLPLDQLPDEAQRPRLLHLLAEAGKLDPRARPTMHDFAARWTAALE